jgi:hypothetical protein
MSQENVEAYRRAVEAFNRPDTEALLEELDPEPSPHHVHGLERGGFLFLDQFAEVRFSGSGFADAGALASVLGGSRDRGVRQRLQHPRQVRLGDQHLTGLGALVA